MFERFEQLLKDENPHFICTPAGSRTAPLPHVAYIDHVVTLRLDNATLAQLRRRARSQRVAYLAKRLTALDPPTHAEMRASVGVDAARQSFPYASLVLWRESIRSVMITRAPYIAWSYND